MRAQSMPSYLLTPALPPVERQLIACPTKGGRFKTYADRSMCAGSTDSGSPTVPASSATALCSGLNDVGRPDVGEWEPAPELFIWFVTPPEGGI